MTLALFEDKGQGFHLNDRLRMAVDATLSKEEILELWVQGMKTWAEQSKEVYVALAMPAPFDYEKGICLIRDQKKFRSLYAVNLREELSGMLGIPLSNIRFINDAEAFLQGEAYFGKGKGFATLLGITLGSGLGSAFKQKERFMDAGLWNMPFKNGIAEDYLGTPWFVHWADLHLGRQFGGLREITEEAESISQLMPMFHAFADNLGDFLAKVHSLHPFEAIVMGGNITRSSHLFFPRLYDRLHAQGILVPVAKSELGELSALLGAVSGCYGWKNLLV